MAALSPSSWRLDGLKAAIDGLLTSPPLMVSKATIARKRPELVNRRGDVFHQDTAKPLVAMSSRRKLLDFEWDVLPHPPYSPDLAPSAYYLILSLKNFLPDKKFGSLEALKIHLD